MGKTILIFPNILFLFFLVIILLMDFGLAVSSQDLLAYYNFEQSSGDLKDISGNENHGVPNEEIVRGEKGIIGNAWQFSNLMNTSVILPSLQVSTNKIFSFSAWIKFDGTPYENGVSDGDIITEATKSNQDTIVKLRIREQEDGGIQIRSDYSAENQRVTTKDKLNDGVFHNLVFVSDGNFLFMYVDGNLSGFVKTPKNNITIDTTTLGATNNSKGLNNHFHGIMDEVSIWNRSLSDSEVFELYEKGISGNLMEVIKEETNFLRRILKFLKKLF